MNLHIEGHFYFRPYVVYHVTLYSIRQGKRRERSYRHSLALSDDSFRIMMKPFVPAGTAAFLQTPTGKRFYFI